MAGPSAGFDRPTLRLDSDNRRRYIMLLVSPREKRSGTTKITKNVQVAPRAHAGLHASALSRSARLHAGGPRNRPARTAGEREGGEHVRRAGSRFGPFAEEPRCGQHSGGPRGEPWGQPFYRDLDPRDFAALLGDLGVDPIVNKVVAH